MKISMRMTMRPTHELTKIGAMNQVMAQTKYIVLMISSTGHIWRTMLTRSP